MRNKIGKYFSCFVSKDVVDDVSTIVMALPFH